MPNTLAREIREGIVQQVFSRFTSREGIITSLAEAIQIEKAATMPNRLAREIREGVVQQVFSRLTSREGIITSIAEAFHRKNPPLNAPPQRFQPGCSARSGVIHSAILLPSRWPGISLSAGGRAHARLPKGHGAVRAD